MLVAVIGTFSSGFEILGPFEDEDDAYEVMQKHPGYRYGGESWDVIEMTDPSLLRLVENG